LEPIDADLVSDVQAAPDDRIPGTFEHGVSARRAFDVPALLWARAPFLFRLTRNGLILAVIIAFLVPVRYRSTTRLMPPDSQSTSGMAMLATLMSRGPGAIGLAPGDLFGMKSTGALFAEMLRSTTIQDHMVDRFNLQKVYRDRYREDARKDLGDYTEVAEDRKSGIITITVTDGDAQRASAMAKGYVDELDRVVAQLSTSSARRERIFIEERLKSVKQDLNAAARQFSEFASQNTALDIKEQTRALVEAAAQLQGQLIVAQSEMEALRQIYTPNNVRVRSVQARINELKKQLDKLGGEASLPSSSGAAPKPLPGESYPTIRQLPLLGVKWADLYRESKLQETVFELLTQQYELAKIQEAKEIPTVHVLDVAAVPERKATPHRAVIVLAGTLLAFLVGVIWIVADARWQAIDPHHPHKQLIYEIADTVSAFACKVYSREKSLLKRVGPKLRYRSSRLPDDTRPDD
jgi:capsule polysaccharide export protein KpsE/RkpR